MTTQTPSMEHHDEVPHHSQYMQFGNHPVVHSQESEETISFGDTTGTPIFFNHPMQDFNDDQSVTTVNEGVTASQLPSHPSHDSADLQDAPSSAGTSSQGRVRKMTRAMAESVSQRDFYGQKKRCTTWRHKQYANTTTIVYMTAILIFKIACVILSRFLQK